MIAIKLASGDGLPWAISRRQQGSLEDEPVDGVGARAAKLVGFPREPFPGEL